MLITHFQIVQRSVLLHLPVNNGGKERQSFRVKKWQRLRRASFSSKERFDRLPNNLLSFDPQIAVLALLISSKIFNFGIVQARIRGGLSKVCVCIQKSKYPSRSESLGELQRILGERERTIRGHQRMRREYARALMMKRVIDLRGSHRDSGRVNCSRGESQQQSSPGFCGKVNFWKLAWASRGEGWGWTAGEKI